MQLAKRCYPEMKEGGYRSPPLVAALIDFRCGEVERGTIVPNVEKAAASLPRQMPDHGVTVAFVTIANTNKLLEDGAGTSSLRAASCRLLAVSALALGDCGQLLKRLRNPGLAIPATEGDREQPISTGIEPSFDVRVRRIPTASEPFRTT